VSNNHVIVIMYANHATSFEHAFNNRVKSHCLIRGSGLILITIPISCNVCTFFPHTFLVINNVGCKSISVRIICHL